MLLLITLLFPLFASLFWAIVLNGDRKNYNIPRSWLAKFLFFSFLIYLGKFFLYVPIPDIYIYFYIIYVYAGSLVYPVYHIYFRLLTVDEKFTWKAHSKHLILPIILVSIYAVGVFFTPSIAFKAFLFDKQASPYYPQVRFLSIMSIVLRVYFMIQLIVVVVQNNLLLRKYGLKAGQFYSDIQDGKYNNAKKLNLILIILGVYTFISFFIFKLDPGIIYLSPLIYAAIMFVIGYMGFTQKPLNPTFDLEDNANEEINETQPLLNSQNKILRKLLTEFEEKKIYLNSQLNILDLVNAIGTNRTYISVIINQHYNQNFCNFVNSYRIEELRRVYSQNPNLSNETLAECCGFGSVSSLKRAIYSKTALSIKEWKKQVVKE
ncbi:MAG: helix-turn-helix domain-containing protein [Paludibacter sp.]